jgi:imidazolonepropionase-like amidohydrolase
MFRLIAFCLLAAPLVWPQTIAIRAGRLFDPKSGTNLSNQVILVRGERIAEAGPATSVQVPAGARVIDLSGATVLPGLIDGHVHTMGGPSGCNTR